MEMLHNQGFSNSHHTHNTIPIPLELKQMTKLKIEDFLFISQKDEDKFIEQFIPAEYKQKMVDRFNSGKVKNPWNPYDGYMYEDAEDYARQWAWEEVYHMWEESNWGEDQEVEFEPLTTEQKKKWKKLWKDNTKWLKSDYLEPDDDHITTTTECESADDFVNYLPDQAHRVYCFAEYMKQLTFTEWVKPTFGPTYKNWPEGKEIPEDMMVYNGVWVIPTFLEEFMPPDEVLNMPDCEVVQVGVDENGADGEYDLFTHEFDDYGFSDFFRFVIDQD